MEIKDPLDVIWITETFTLTAEGKPTGGNITNWKSSNPNIAQINTTTGALTGLKEGTVDMTVDYIYKGVTCTSKPVSIISVRLMKRMPALIINGCIFGIVCCLNMNVVAGEVNVEQFPAEINKQLHNLQVRFNKTATLDKLMILQKDLTKIQGKIDLLPASKEKEELEKKFNLLSASFKKERMSIKAEEIEPNTLLARFLLVIIRDEKDLDALLEEVRKV